MMLYHGSRMVIEKPMFGVGKVTNDYGLGFYCTEHRELACEWACPTRTDGFVNAYDIDLTGLKVLNLNDQDYGILHWLYLLVVNRPVRLESQIQEEGMKWIQDHFSLDISDYDIVRGYRADDSYFGFVRSFLENGISLAQLRRAMRLGNLGEQVVLKSRLSFDALSFRQYEVVSWQVYHLKRVGRDQEAKRQFQDELKDKASDGLYMVDILRGKMEADDARLR